MQSADDGAEAAQARSERALLDLLGLATRARAVLHGTDLVRRAVREGKVKGVLLAADAAPAQAAKLLPLLEARGVPHAACLARETIGAAVGREAVSAAGFTDANFARRALELARLLHSPEA